MPSSRGSGSAGGRIGMSYSHNASFGDDGPYDYQESYSDD